MSDNTGLFGDGMMGGYGNNITAASILRSRYRQPIAQAAMENSEPNSSIRNVPDNAFQAWLNESGQRLMNPTDTIAQGVQNFTQQDPVDMGMSLFGGGLGTIKATQTAGELAQKLAHDRAMLPKSEHGLGLPAGNTAMDRANAQGAVDYLHGTERLDRLLSGKNLDPRRATSGPMPFGTDSPDIASRYAMSKQDTSRMNNDMGGLDQYFQVSPKSLGYRGTNPYTVEQSWHHLSPDVRADILDKSRRIGYQNTDEASGAWTLHPTSKGAPFGDRTYDYALQEAKGNPLAALRRLYGESGMLDPYAPSELADIYKLSGYPHEISQTNAPWTEAKGVLLGKAMIERPLNTGNVEEVQSTVIPALKEAFAKDRTRTSASNSDQWAKNSRWTPKEWVNQLEADVTGGHNSYVWTSIPDKVTEQLKKLGYQGIIDTGGKGGGAQEGHQVVIPFNPYDIRSRFAAFDPWRRNAAIAALTGTAAPDLMAGENDNLVNALRSK